MRNHARMFDEPLLGAACEPRHRGGKQARRQQHPLVGPIPQVQHRHEPEPRRDERRASPDLLEVGLAVQRAVPGQHRHRDRRKQHRDRIETASGAKPAKQDGGARGQQHRIQREASLGTETFDGPGREGRIDVEPARRHQHGRASGHRGGSQSRDAETNQPVATAHDAPLMADRVPYRIR